MRKNHAREREVWLRIDKKGRASLSSLVLRRWRPFCASAVFRIPKRLWPKGPGDRACTTKVLTRRQPAEGNMLAGANSMARKAVTPFESLESAHEFMSLLREAVDDAYSSILDDIEVMRETKGAERRVDALRIVDHKLNRLRQNVLASLILLNDLKMLRRLLLSEPLGTGAGPMDEA